DLFIAGIASAVVSLLVLHLWYPLIGATQSPGYLLPYRYTPQLVRLVYFWILATVVWIGIKTIGGLLIGALLVIPVLIVRNHVRSFLMTTVSSTIVALMSVTGGLFLALYIDLPPSSIIIGVLLTLFVISSLYHSVRRRY
ncbi:MAG: hypothetical protein F6K48_34985, partial [Okeania sp. SIO3H1]|nr:hypothetical protein [Okeania sp. SIO3H1]